MELVYAALSSGLLVSTSGFKRYLGLFALICYVLIFFLNR